MNRLLSLLFTLLLIAVLGVGLVVLAGLDSRPLVAGYGRLSHFDVARARRLLQANDPRRLPAGSEADLVLSEEDLDLVANYLLQRKAEGGAQIELEQGTLTGRFTLYLPDNPINPYLNLGLGIEERAERPRLVWLAIGRTELPLDLDAQWLGTLLTRLFGREELPLLQSSLRRMRLEPHRMTLVYGWDPRLLGEARRLLARNSDPEAIVAYHRHLEEVLRQHPGTLADLLSPMFRFARDRSEASDPVAENRSVLLALGLYATGRDPGTLLPGLSGLRNPGGPWVRLQGREDLTRHFLVSAAASAAGDAGLSDALGVYKEWQDSQGGSGFSFVDLAADRAGTRFGELATGSTRRARLLQERVAEGLKDTDLLPPVRDLPEGMSERTLERGFGGVGGERYERMRRTIERRLDAAPLYRPR